MEKKKSQIMGYSSYAMNSHVKQPIAKTKEASGKEIRCYLWGMTNTPTHSYVPPATCSPHTKAHIYPSVVGEFQGLLPSLIRIGYTDLFPKSL